MPARACLTGPRGTPMASESEKRAVALAVSRFGIDAARVDEALAAVDEARARGETLDLIDLLLQRDVLTTAQAQEIRALDVTQLDTAAPNGEADGRVIPEGPRDSAIVEPGDDELRGIGDYRILRRLGTGGMGDVYLGYREENDSYVALKVLPAPMAMNQTLLDRFYREAKSGALLDHPNIVRNITVGKDSASGKHYLVLEYVDGPSVQTLLDERGRLPVGDAVHIVLDVAKALEHAHSRNVVHRDIKPANILITASGVAKLADLGLAKRTDEASHLTATRQGFGTPYYMPYEQAMNARTADARSDIYALGATLYHLVTGELPFPGTTHLEIVDKKNLGYYDPASVLNNEVPAALDQILARMLAREPRDRYQTASELIVDLERAGLAAAVPSFVDRERALQDPLVRERLATPAQPTYPDVRVHGDPAAADAGHLELWYLRFRDRYGRLCKAKATLEQVLTRVRDAKLPKDAEASQSKHGDFQPLEHFPQFRDALAAADQLRPVAKKRRPSAPVAAPVTPGPADSAIFLPQRVWLMWALAATAGALLLAVILYVIFRPI